MFCSKCGNQLQDGVLFCPKCGNAVNNTRAVPVEKETKVMLEPSEVIKHGENNGKKTTSGHAGTYGIVLMIVSVILSLISMFAVGFEAFIPITVLSTALFVVGFLLRMFCP